MIAAADPFFVLVIGAVVVLVLLAIAFALVTVRLRILNDRKAERWGKLEARWEPLVLEVLSGEEDPSRLMASVEEDDKLLFLDFLLRYHRRLSGGERNTLRALAEPFLPYLLSRAGSRSAETRARAIQTFSELGLPDYAGVVIAALDDESAIVEMIAARAIFRNKISEAYPDVIRRLPNFSLWSRKFISTMLVTGGPDVAPTLRDLVHEKSRSVRDRAIALDALRALRDLESLEVATTVLTDEDDRELLAAALRLVEEVGFADHAAVVRPLASSDDQVVRGAAVGALGAIGDVRDYGLLAARIEDPSTWVALEAARALKALGARQVLTELARDDAAILAKQVLDEAGS